MADLFGHWVPEEQISQVIDVMTSRRVLAHVSDAEQVSDSPARVQSLPENVWVGVSLPAGHLMSETGGARALKAYLRHMNAKIDANSTLHEH